MKTSLVISTIGRAAELRQLLASLAAQSCRDFEVLVVDQSREEAIAGVVAEFAGQMEFRHLPMYERGASRGRNFGWAEAKGDILNFPDDDCTWPPELLERVVACFAARPELAGLVTRVETMGRMDTEGGPVTRQNIFGRCVEFAIFLRRTALGELRFDESMGVGAPTPWGADEGPDLLLRMLERGLSVEYVPELCIFHPDPRQQPPATLLRRTLAYSRGRGYLLRKHRYSLAAVAYALFRSLGGALVMLATGRITLARQHWLAFWGKLVGYVTAGKPPAQVVSAPPVAASETP